MLLYDINDTMIMERSALASAAGQALSRATRIWHIFDAARTSDGKRNAGAKTRIRRTPTRAVAGSLPQIGLNIEPWCVPVGPQKLLFLPDRLLVWDGSRLVGVPYEDLSIRAESTRFVEEEAVPSDARQVGTTWRYVNKKGGPDRRFTDNKRLPVLEYGTLELRSASGLRVVLQTSSPEAVAGAERALTALASDASPAAPVGNAADAATVRSVAILLRYIASADRRISEDEVAFALAVLSGMKAGRPIAATGFDSWFRALPADTDSIDAAIATVQALGEEGRRRVVEMVVQMAGADGRATPKETERRRWLERRLGAHQVGAA